MFKLKYAPTFIYLFPRRIRGLIFNSGLIIKHDAWHEHVSRFSFGVTFKKKLDIFQMRLRTSFSEYGFDTIYWDSPMCIMYEKLVD